MPHTGTVVTLGTRHEAPRVLGISSRQFRRWCRRHGVLPLHTRYGSAQDDLYDLDTLRRVWRETRPGPPPGPAGMPAGGPGGTPPRPIVPGRTGQTHDVLAAGDERDVVSPMGCGAGDGPRRTSLPRGRCPSDRPD